MKAISLEDVVAELRTAYGSSLHAVVMYGSAARAERPPQGSDINLLIITGDTSRRRMIGAAAAVARWSGEGNPPPLIFTGEEWRASADIFPMEYADVIETHRVLFGTFGVTQLSVDMQHFRLQLEQECMGKLLRMRQGAMYAGDSDDKCRELLEVSFRKILVLLRALLRLHGRRPPSGDGDLVREAARLASFDDAALLGVSAQVSGSGQLARGQSAAMVDALLGALERLVSHVNSYTPERSTYSALPSEAIQEKQR